MSVTMSTILRRSRCLSLLLLTACSKPDLPQPNASFPPAETTRVVQTVPTQFAPPPPASEFYKKVFEIGIPKKEMEAFRAALPYEQISLRSIGGWTPNESAVTFFRNGKATLHSLDGDRTSTFEGEVNVRNYARLCYVLDQLQFQSFRGEYHANWTDDSTRIVTTVSSSGVTKRVLEYGRVGPIELWTIQELLDGTRARMEWKSVETQE